MPRPGWDNLDDFLDPRDFAVEVTVTPQAGPVRRFSAIFDERYLNGITGEYEADSGQSRCACKMADAAGLVRGDAIDVPGEGRFNLMTNPQPDGTGMAVLVIARDA